MAPPVATDATFSHNSNGVVSSTSVDPTGTVLVIGSMASAQSGAYQKAVEAYLRSQVEMHMVDRLTDGATQLTPSTYPLAHLTVPYADAPLHLYSIELSLHSAPPNAKIVVDAGELVDATTAQKVKAELTIAGFTNVQTDETGLMSATKPATARASSFSIGSSSGTSALPLRRKLGGASNAKKSLWSTQPASSSDLIDQASLLRDADLSPPPQSSVPIATWARAGQEEESLQGMYMWPARVAGGRRPRRRVQRRPAGYRGYGHARRRSGGKEDRGDRDDHR